MPENILIITISDDAMAPRANVGDRAEINVAALPKNNSIVYVELNGAPTIRRITREGNAYRLTADNPIKYPDIITEKPHVLGVVENVQYDVF